MTKAKGEPAEVKPEWELLPHGADVRVLGRGPTPEAAFEQAALALTAIVTTAEVADKTSVSVACEAPDIELLLVEWLNAIIYEMAVNGMLFGRYEVRMQGTRLGATLWGEPVDRKRHSPACEPKGATYTALHAGRDADGSWSATCVVDV